MCDQNKAKMAFFQTWGDVILVGQYGHIPQNCVRTNYQCVGFCKAIKRDLQGRENKRSSEIDGEYMD